MVCFKKSMLKLCICSRQLLVFSLTYGCFFFLLLLLFSFNSFLCFLISIVVCFFFHSFFLFHNLLALFWSSPSSSLLNCRSWNMEPLLVRNKNKKKQQLKLFWKIVYSYMVYQSHRNACSLLRFYYAIDGFEHDI